MILKRVVSAICVTLITGCVSEPPVHKETRERLVARAADRAYLIIDVARVDVEEPQPTWLAIRPRRGGINHLPADREIFAVRSGRMFVDHIDYNMRLSQQRRSLLVPHPPQISAAKGVIHYYGKLEVYETDSRRRVRTVLDLDLLRRACVAKPALFRLLEVVVVGPLAREKVSLPDCKSLLAQKNSTEEVQ